MNITINSTTDLFYRQLLELLSNFNPIKKLRAGEIKVLAEIMARNYEYKHLSTHIRRNIIFSKDIKAEMCSKLEISRDTFNTNISILRKNGILNKDNTLLNALNIFPDKDFTFSVTFKINDNE